MPGASISQILSAGMHLTSDRKYNAVQAMNGSGAQSHNINDTEVTNHSDVPQHPGFMRQLSSSVDGSQSDMQSVSEQAPGPDHATHQAQTSHPSAGQPGDAVPAVQVDAWSQSGSIPDDATTSAPVESGARPQLTMLLTHAECASDVLLWHCFDMICTNLCFSEQLLFCAC